METARIFWSERSQAVRLRKEFRFDTDEVRIQRHGSGLILEPIAQDWAWLGEIIGPSWPGICPGHPRFLRRCIETWTRGS